MVEWYYAKGDQQLGPVNSRELKQLASDGELQPDDLVWREGMSDWKEASHVKKLFRKSRRRGTIKKSELAPIDEIAQWEAPEGDAGPLGMEPDFSEVENEDEEAPAGAGEMPGLPPMAFGPAGPPQPDEEKTPAGPVIPGMGTGVADTPSAGIPPAGPSATPGATPAAMTPASMTPASMTPPAGTPPSMIPPAAGTAPPSSSAHVPSPRDSQATPDYAGQQATPQPGPSQPGPSQPWSQPVEPHSGAPGGHMFDMLLNSVRPQLTTGFVDSFAKVFQVLGHYGLYAAMIVGLIFPVVVEASIAKFLVFGMIWVLALLVLQYVAERFTAVLRRLNRQTEGQLSSTAFLDSFAVLAMVTGLAALAGLTMIAVRDGAYLMIFLGLLIFSVSEYAAIVSLVPTSLQIAIAPRTASGEEAIGVFSFLMKVVARVVPVAFGAGVLYGTIAVLLACYAVTFAEIGFVDASPAAVEGVDAPGEEAGGDAANDADEKDAKKDNEKDKADKDDADKEKADSGEEDVTAESRKAPPLVAAGEARPFFHDYPGALAHRIPIEQSALAGMKWIVLFALLPFLAYLVFLAYYLSVDIIRAILALPGKLDDLSIGEVDSK